MTVPAQARGTSNGNCSGNSEARRRRKVWLVETYRADVDVEWLVREDGSIVVWPASELALFTKHACRCYRCGCLLITDTVTADRIIPGDEGGTYRRENIRPACGSCNSITGNLHRWAKERAKKDRRTKAAAWSRAARTASANQN